jgi:hypothetical protein
MSDYQLKEFIDGIGQNATHPFGLTPEGFLLYDESSNSMAVCLWDPQAKDVLNPIRKIKDLDIIYFMKLYFCYCGKYWLDSNIMNHYVTISAFPNYNGDVLLRRLNVDNKILTLSAFTQTKVHKIPETEDKLTWELMTVKNDFLTLVGTWQVQDYRESNRAIFGEKPLGQMTISSSGYISMQVANKDLKPWKNNNSLLVENEELIDTFNSFRSFFVKYEMDDKKSLKCECLSPFSYHSLFSIRYDHKNNDLKFSYNLQGKDTEIEIQSLWRRM